MAASPKSNAISARWTPTLIEGGFTPVSDYFLDNYHRLSPPIRTSEAMLIIQLMRHKWDSDAPYPGFKSLAKKMGISVQAARLHARTLEKHGYLRREMKVGETNRFHLAPLFNALEVHMRQHAPERTRQRERDDSAGLVPLTLGETMPEPRPRRRVRVVVKRDE